MKSIIKTLIVIVLLISSTTLVFAQEVTPDEIDHPEWEYDSLTTYEDYILEHPIEPYSGEVLYETSDGFLADNQLVVIVVNSLLELLIGGSLDQYIADLESENYSVEKYAVFGGTPDDIRTYLQGKLAEGLVGAVLIGDLPVPWFEFSYECDAGLCRNCWPEDFFYMDLNGTWEDKWNFEWNPLTGWEKTLGANGVNDTYTGDYRPEIWVGRLTVPKPKYLLTEGQRINDYFDKNHAYRTGQTSRSWKALVYIDDEWANLEQADLEVTHLDELYQDITVIREYNTTVAEDYKNRLDDGYEFLELTAHSSSQHHAFFVDGGETLHSSFSWDEIESSNPTILFYHDGGCSNARYIEDNYMGGEYIFNPNSPGLFLAGLTSPGGNPLSGAYANALNERKNFGEAYVDHLYSYSDEYLQMNGFISKKTLIGDPTLRVKCIITVTSPSSGEDWLIYNTKTIRWNSSGSGNYVKIELGRPTGCGLAWSTITSSTSNTGSYNWPVQGPAKNNCKIRICSIDNPDCCGESPSFDIVLPTITVTSPATGEDWGIGSSKTIRWNSSGVTGNVKIELGRPSGCGWSWSTITSSTSNTGSYNWIVQGPAQNNCKIRITSIAHTDVYGESGLFDIVGTATTSSSTSSTTTSISGDTTKPTIDGPYQGVYQPLGTFTEDEDVEFWWLHSDNDSGININSIKAEYKHANDYDTYKSCTLTQRNSDSAAAIFPIASANLPNDDYFIKITVKDNAGNEAFDLTLVWVEVGDVTKPEIPYNEIKIAVPGVGEWPIDNDIIFNPGSNSCIKWKSTDNVGVTKSYYRYRREGSSLERTSDPLPSKSYLAKPAGRSGDYSWFYPAETILEDNDPGGGPGTYYIALVAEDAAGNKYERDNVCRIIVEY